jgi:hypothetical protein
VRAISELDPIPRRLARRRFPLPPVTAVVAYGQSFPTAFLETVGALEAAGFSLRAWSLGGQPHPKLRPFTVGGGPGTRLRHLNELARSVDPSHHLLLLDDDVVFRRGDPQTFVGLARWFGLDVAQPAHGRGSYASFNFVFRVPGTIARETTFVEQGPAVLLSPRARRQLLPFDDEGMSWGIEVDWYRAERDGLLRLGIVDGVEIKHLRRPGATYERGIEVARARAKLASVNASRFPDIQRVRRRHWRIPPSPVAVEERSA